jgi:hypothetical protein
MTLSWKSLSVAALVYALPAAAQSAQFPATPQGKLAAGFFAAVNSTDDEALGVFQDANFSEAALKRRPREQRIALGKELRDQAGTLTLKEVKSASTSQMVVIASGSNLPPNSVLTISFTFTGNGAPKIDGVQITS